MRKSSICFVIPSLRQGGAERVLVEVANELSKGYEVSIINFDDETSYYPLKTGIAVYKVGNLRGRFPGRAVVNLTRRLISIAALVRRIDPDVIISFLDIASVNVLLATIIGSRKPIILSEHCNPDDSLLSPVQKAMRKQLYRRAAAIVNPTQDAFEIFARLGIELPPIRRVITNPLSVHLTPKVDVLAVERENVVLYVGRLSPEKQVDHLIDIFHAARLPGWQLRIIGDGPERGRLEAYANQRFAGASPVVFLGQQKELIDHYQTARILTLTSRTEGLSNVLLEAMCNGCVCISYDCKVGPSTLIQHNVNGVLVPPQNKEAFVSELVCLATNLRRYSDLQSGAVQLKDAVVVERIGLQWAELVHLVTNRNGQREVAELSTTKGP
jgi:GalNAc-alpha-(1->4)-GalNAc-alpha-(1->3)-diNAcBac-PP-undecaprenol alpha-1,4-N-acetyl-D-galactosaminyltransferase